MRQIKNIREITKPYAHPSQLDSHNHAALWPLCRCGYSGFRPYYTLCKDVEIEGYGKAPFPSLRGYQDAIVFFCSDEEYEYCNGIIWIHCNLDDMNFDISRKSKLNFL